MPPLNWRGVASRALPVILLLAGWGLRVHALAAKSLWYDELRQVEVAQAPLSQMNDLLIEHAARPQLIACSLDSPVDFGAHLVIRII